jgi:hypothetical protein
MKLERLARDKHFSILQKTINYGRKKFNSTSPKGEEIESYDAVPRTTTPSTPSGTTRTTGVNVTKLFSFVADDKA